LQRHSAWEGGGAVASFMSNYADAWPDFCEPGHTLSAKQACSRINGFIVWD